MSTSWLLIVPLVLLGDINTSDIRLRVLGGKKANPLKHGYLVYLSSNIANALCSGAVIGEDWIVSAAHCASQKSKDISVYHSNVTFRNFRQIGLVKKSNVFPHPNHKSDKDLSYDIMLLKTSKSIEFTQGVTSIQLGHIPKEGQSCILTGWGLTGTDIADPGYTLQEGFVTITPCGANLKNILCSKDIARAGPGDSGGPLVTKGRLVGVTVASCLDVSGPQICLTVYASVDAHRKWIKKVMGSD